MKNKITITLITVIALTGITLTILFLQSKNVELAPELQKVEDEVSNNNQDLPLLENEYTGPNENEGLPNQSRYLIPSDEN